MRGLQPIGETLDPAPSSAEMRSLFDKWSNELSDVIERMDDASWNRTAQFYYGSRMACDGYRSPYTTIRLCCAPPGHVADRIPDAIPIS